MISVIVPTMWAYEPFLNFIENVMELNCIGEVVIINNCVEDTPIHNALKHPKIKMHNMQRNIFVNPAWNLGAKLSQCETLCFLSDDVLVDLRVFMEADKFVSREIGVLGFGYHPTLFNMHAFKKIDSQNIDEFIIKGDIKIKLPKEGEIVATTGNGSLFFLNRQNYILIPEEFLISGGDNWEYQCQEILGRKNYFINDCFFYSPWSVTANSGKLDASYADFSKENRENFIEKIEEFKRNVG